MIEDCAKCKELSALKLIAEDNKAKISCNVCGQFVIAETYRESAEKWSEAQKRRNLMGVVKNEGN